MPRTGTAKIIQSSDLTPLERVPDILSEKMRWIGAGGSTT